MDFETQTTRKGKKKASKKQQKGGESDSEESLEETKVPIYLGINLHDDAKMNVKLREILQNHLKLLIQEFNSTAVEETIESIS